MTIEDITGKYVNVEIEGQTQRVYFEEAGTGRPVLCLHTAGADTRQWRHLLNDTEVTSEHRLIAFDMPWHGKSLPPAGFEQEEYLLTTDTYIATVLAVCEALALDRPILAGCSMGGVLRFNWPRGTQTGFPVSLRLKPPIFKRRGMISIGSTVQMPMGAKWGPRLSLRIFRPTRLMWNAGTPCGCL
ncbi:alpha/beta fold hydrolase [Sulfitobacter pacificus]|uniref:alpha/beta fold hydrolase n=1 Tax=Sulfitobacter pacificus TaxID=1499314 RepID=UPI003608BF3C